jgi:GT2 family glycosyltransferase
MLRELGYLDEAYAPMGEDDMDVCFKAWRKGWVSGVYPMHAFFKTEDGSTRRSENSANVTARSWVKNEKILINRYHDLITGPKHTEVRLVEA